LKILIYKIKIMSEENKIDQPIPAQAVEDVFSNVEEATNVPTSPAPQEPVQANVNISEASIGQEESVAPVQKEEVRDEASVSSIPEEIKEGPNTSKIFFYLILSLIILLGAFAIWALVF
jgi:hypothetical protein